MIRSYYIFPVPTYDVSTINQYKFAQNPINNHHSSPIIQSIEMWFSTFVAILTIYCTGSVQAENLDYGGGQGFGGGHVITNTIPVPQPFPVHVEQQVPVPVHVPVDKPYPVHVDKPYPVKVEKTVTYKVDKPIPYPVKVPVKIPVIKRVEVYVPRPYPVPVDRPYPVPVPQTYVVEKKVPVYIQGGSHGSFDLYSDGGFSSGHSDFGSFH